MARTYPALARPAFAGFIFGQTLSNLGTWFQLIAQSLLILDIAGSGKALGITASLQFLPMLLVTPYAGIIVDRVQARQVLIVSNLVASAVAFALWAVTAAGVVTEHWVWLLAPIFGLSQTFDRPASGALLAELVSPAERTSANALSSVVNSSGRMIGPAIAGVLYAAYGPAICFLLNGISYAFVVVPLLRIRRDRMTVRPRREELGAIAQLVAGIRYVAHRPALRAPMVWTAIIGLLAFNFFSVVPAFLRFEYGQGGTGIGIAEAVNAGAAVLAGLWIARRPQRPSRRYIAGTSLAFSIGLGGLAVMPTFGWFLAWSPVFGVAFMYWLTAVTNTLQTETEPAFIGRVMSLFALGVFGTTPVGSLITGWMIDHWSARHALALGLVGTIPAALWLWFVSVPTSQDPAPR